MIDVLLGLAPFMAAVCFFGIASLEQKGDGRCLMVAVMMTFGACMVALGFELMR